MSQTNRIAWEVLRSVDSATFTGVYVNLGTPLKFPSYICKMVNRSTVDVVISTDGINDMDICPANGFWLYDEGKVGVAGYFPALSEGTQIMVKGAASIGLVYLVSQYIIQG
jgi:hypothetical protein